MTSKNSPKPPGSSSSIRSGYWDRDRQEKEKDYKLSKSVLEQITKEAFDVFDQDQTSYIWRGYI